MSARYRLSGDGQHIIEIEKWNTPGAEAGGNGG